VLYGTPAICAGIAVLAYGLVSTVLPLSLGGIAVLTLGRRAPRGRREDEPARKLAKYETGRNGPDKQRLPLQGEDELATPGLEPGFP
jgi:hypothetical protein